MSLLGNMIGLGMYASSSDSVRSAESAARDARSDAERAASRSHLIEDKLDKLTIICLAMWSLIQEETKLTEEDLLKRVQQIDVLDGKTDGKITPQIARCAKCNRVMNPRHKKCLYCGHEKLILSAFDTLPS